MSVGGSVNKKKKLQKLKNPQVLIDRERYGAQLERVRALQLAVLPERERYDRSTVVLRLSFFFSGRRRHTRSDRDWSSDVCSSDLRRRRPPRSNRGRSTSRASTARRA